MFLQALRIRNFFFMISWLLSTDSEHRRNHLGHTDCNQTRGKSSVCFQVEKVSFFFSLLFFFKTFWEVDMRSPKCKCVVR